MILIWTTADVSQFMAATRNAIENTTPLPPELSSTSNPQLLIMQPLDMRDWFSVHVIVLVGRDVDKDVHPDAIHDKIIKLKTH